MIKFTSNAILYLVILGLSLYLYKLNGEFEALKNSIEIMKTTNEATSKLLLEKLQQSAVPQTVTVVDTSVELKRDFLKYIFIAFGLVALTGGVYFMFNGFSYAFFFKYFITLLNAICPSIFVNETVMQYNGYSLKVVTDHSNKIIDILIKLKSETSYKTLESTINHFVLLNSNNVVNEIASSVVVKDAEMGAVITELADKLFI
jgi:hypothetical protein